MNKINRSITSRISKSMERSRLYRVLFLPSIYVPSVINRFILGHGVDWYTMFSIVKVFLDKHGLSLVITGFTAKPGFAEKNLGFLLENLVLLRKTWSIRAKPDLSNRKTSWSAGIWSCTLALVDMLLLLNLEILTVPNLIYWWLQFAQKFN